MRVLVVNAHTNSIESQRHFQDLLAYVKEILRNHNGLLEIKDEYIVRTRDNLDDFLYDEGTSFNLPSIGKEFDSLDFVIISGDLHCLPWQANNTKVLILLQMCLRVKKCLFAIGFAMQALVYLSASGLEHPITVINGNGKGGKLGEMSSLPFKPEKIKTHEHFLDNVTGDLYHFQAETKEWAPLCNIGLHSRRTAQEFNTLGKYVIKTPIYRPKKVIHNNGQVDIHDENVETKCYTKKVYLNHWLFIGCDMEYIVPYRGRWEIHSFNFTNKEKAFEVLAESEMGPLIIEFPRIIGVKFPISKRYKETFKILKNFIIKYAADIISTGKCQSTSVLSYAGLKRSYEKTYRFADQTDKKGKTDNFFNYKPVLPDTTRNGFKPPAPLVVDAADDAVVFRHSGMASKMKGKFILEHNFISPGRVYYDADRNTPIKNGLSILSGDALLGKYGIITKKSQQSRENSDLDLHRNFPERSALKTSLLTSRNKNNMKNHIKTVSIFDPADDLLMMPLRTDPGESTLTKESIRKILYPELCDLNQEFDKKIWVPGSLSQTKTSSLSSPKTAVRISTGLPNYRKVGPVAKINPEDTDPKTLRASDPYKTYDDLAKDYQKKEDEKILGPKKFIITKNSTNSLTIPSSPSNSMRMKLLNLTSARHVNY